MIIIFFIEKNWISMQKIGDIFHMIVNCYWLSENRFKKQIEPEREIIP